ncbi:FdtA/QdtA family cupin domain-containing protein [Achromobacter sp. ACRQX]|uniref:sugar 3,4-ketoisomerase n=1 Tax=Achromobacter sp. ACRQX TaxID=2918181 RepID=UPI001EF2DED8|nr:FdtA/QdtA family cupin domain-containing protein [Achromobacter sp. ACRQX]MCG7328574.1 FdtA/QdtA family cupin domain-containing protein [Achromobacter sp. ACRQX]
MTSKPAQSLDDAIQLIDLTKITDPRGNLTFIEANKHVPFDIQRVYYLYDVPSGEMRAGHAHHDLQQLIIGISGSFDLLLDNGYEKRTITCNRPFQGVLMKSLVWRELNNFSSGAVCLVLASMHYTESDYIRNYADFLKVVAEKNPS